MFTGIVKDIGEVKETSRRGDGIRLRIQFHSSQFDDLSVDESVNCNGVCQTVVSNIGNTFEVDTIKETLLKTTLGEWHVGKKVNLERALRAFDRMGGHYVQGHVDTIGKVIKVNPLKSSWELRIEFEKSFEPNVVPVGSIAIDGVSLTIAEVNGCEIKVSIIPYTWTNTTLSHLSVGSMVNLEFDILGKYVQKQLHLLHEKPTLLNEARLKDLGY